MITCPACHSSLQDTSARCAYCGYWLDEPDSVKSDAVSLPRPAPAHEKTEPAQDDGGDTGYNAFDPALQEAGSGQAPVMQDGAAPLRGEEALPQPRRAPRRIVKKSSVPAEIPVKRGFLHRFHWLSTRKALAAAAAAAAVLYVTVILASGLLAGAGGEHIFFTREGYLFCARLGDPDPITALGPAAFPVSSPVNGVMTLTSPPLESGVFEIYASPVLGAERRLIAGGVKEVITAAGGEIMWLDSTGDIYTCDPASPGEAPVRIGAGASSWVHTQDGALSAWLDRSSNLLTSGMGLTGPADGPVKRIEGFYAGRLYYQKEDGLYRAGSDGTVERLVAGSGRALAVYGDGSVLYLKDAGESVSVSGYVKDSLKTSDAGLSKPKAPVPPNLTDYFFDPAGYRAALTKYQSDLGVYNKKTAEYGAKLERDRIRSAISSMKAEQTLGTLVYATSPESVSPVAESCTGVAYCSGEMPFASYSVFDPSRVDKPDLKDFKTADALKKKVASELNRSAGSRVSFAADSFPFEDGEHVFYSCAGQVYFTDKKSGAGRLMRFNLKDGTAVQLADDASHVTVCGQRLFYLRGSSTDNDLVDAAGQVVGKGVDAESMGVSGTVLHFEGISQSGQDVSEKALHIVTGTGSCVIPGEVRNWIEHAGTVYWIDGDGSIRSVSPGSDARLLAEGADSIVGIFELDN